MKRILDLFISISLLLLFSPIIGVVAILVRGKLGSPIIYKQLRPGLHKIPFTIYKFRTMTDQRDSVGQLLPDHIRLTSFGSFLRKYSLDELVQLVNVAKGDLSIVGPRPLLMEYLPLYNSEQSKRHQVKPGITGWAQVNGRNAITWEEKFQLDVWYVNNRSILLDMKIIFLTVMKVIVSEGINQSRNATMERFTGSNSTVGGGAWMKIILIGNGGHSKVIRELILSHKGFEIVGYLDDKYNDIGKKISGYLGPVLSAKRIANNFTDIKFVIAIGDNKVRRKIAREINLPEEYFITLVHKSAVVSPTAKIGKGTVVMPNTVINADAEIGQHTIINTGSVIEHDSIIGDFVHVSPGTTLTGTVHLEEGVSIGAGATIIPNMKIGTWSIIGAGATVINHIPSYCTAVGIPARVNKMNENGGELIDKYVI